MLKLMKFGIKVGIASSAFYVTLDNGVWKDSETTTKLYDKIKTESFVKLEPYVKQIPISLPEIPRTGSLVSNLEVTWNKAVIASLNFLIALPSCSVGYAKKTYTYLDEKIREAVDNSNGK